MTRIIRQPHIDGFDDEHSQRDRSSRPSGLPKFTPGFAWNSKSQEFIPILPEGHPGYEQNREIVAAAIRRWNAGTSKK